MKLKKGDFVGKPALEKQKEAGIPRKLIGFTLVTLPLSILLLWAAVRRGRRQGTIIES